MLRRCADSLGRQRNAGRRLGDWPRLSRYVGKIAGMGAFGKSGGGRDHAGYAQSARSQALNSPVFLGCHVKFTNLAFRALDLDQFARLI